MESRRGVGDRVAGSAALADRPTAWPPASTEEWVSHEDALTLLVRDLARQLEDQAARADAQACALKRDIEGLTSQASTMQRQVELTQKQVELREVSIRQLETRCSGASQRSESDALRREQAQLASTIQAQRGTFSDLASFQREAQDRLTKIEAWLLEWKRAASSALPEGGALEGRMDLLERRLQDVAASAQRASSPQPASPRPTRSQPRETGSGGPAPGTVSAEDLARSMEAGGHSQQNLRLASELKQQAVTYNSAVLKEFERVSQTMIGLCERQETQERSLESQAASHRELSSRLAALEAATAGGTGRHREELHGAVHERLQRFGDRVNSLEALLGTTGEQHSHSLTEAHERFSQLSVDLSAAQAREQSQAAKFADLVVTVNGLRDAQAKLAGDMQVLSLQLNQELKVVQRAQESKEQETSMAQEAASAGAKEVSLLKASCEALQMGLSTVGQEVTSLRQCLEEQREVILRQSRKAQEDTLRSALQKFNDIYQNDFKDVFSKIESVEMSEKMARDEHHQSIRQLVIARDAPQDDSQNSAGDLKRIIDEMAQEHIHKSEEVESRVQVLAGELLASSSLVNQVDGRLEVHRQLVETLSKDVQRLWKALDTHTHNLDMLASEGKDVHDTLPAPRIISERTWSPVRATPTSLIASPRQAAAPITSSPQRAIYTTVATRSPTSPMQVVSPFRDVRSPTPSGASTINEPRGQVEPDAFRILDTNNDGVISREEFRRALNKTMLSGSPATSPA